MMPPQCVAASGRDAGLLCGPLLPPSSSSPLAAQMPDGCGSVPIIHGRLDVQVHLSLSLSANHEGFGTAWAWNKKPSVLFWCSAKGGRSGFTLFYHGMAFFIFAGSAPAETHLKFQVCNHLLLLILRFLQIGFKRCLRLAGLQERRFFVVLLGLLATSVKFLHVNFCLFLSNRCSYLARFVGCFVAFLSLFGTFFFLWRWWGQIYPGFFWYL